MQSPWHVVLTAPVSTALGALRLPRRVLVAILADLHGLLPSTAGSYRSRRDPTDSDRFVYPVRAFDGSHWHVLDFAVNDTQAADYLFIEAVAHRIEPA